MYYTGGGLGNPLQYSCLEIPTDRGAWRATVHRVAKSQIGLKQLSIHMYICITESLCYASKINTENQLHFSLKREGKNMGRKTFTGSWDDCPKLHPEDKRLLSLTEVVVHMAMESLLCLFSR